MAMGKELPVIRPRGSLKRTRAAVSAGRLAVGFLGGSITAGDPLVGGMDTNWPLFIHGFFQTQYPHLALSLYNAAIGGTCSLSGLMRVEREILAHDCDLVFIEYAVNDDGTGPYRHSREGLIRRLLEQSRDVLLVYTYSHSMYDDMLAGRIPSTIANFEELAERYRLPSVWMGLHAFRQILANRLSWEEFLPESGGRLHPYALGSHIYAEPVLTFLNKELTSASEETIPFGEGLPQPISPGHYQHIREIPPDNWELKGPWLRQRVLNNPWYDTEIRTDSVEASLTIHFTGRMLAAAIDFGRTSAVLHWRMDGGDWQEAGGSRQDWTPMRGWTMALPIADGLSAEEHVFEMRPAYGKRPYCQGTECRLYAFVTAD